MQTPLRVIGNWLASNGAAIYNTTGYPFGANVSECEVMAGLERCYTRSINADRTFAIFLGWPDPGVLIRIPHLHASPSCRAAVLGHSALPPMAVSKSPQGGIAFHAPDLSTLLDSKGSEAAAWTVTFEGCSDGHSSAETEPAQASRSTGCEWDVGQVTGVQANFTCAPGALGSDTSVKVTLSSPHPGDTPVTRQPAPSPAVVSHAAVDSIDTRTVAYRADEPPEAKHVSLPPKPEPEFSIEGRTVQDRQHFHGQSELVG